jgi:aquaporin Z
LVAAVLREKFVHPPVSAVATLPGPGGPIVAFLAEMTITFVLMLTVLLVTNTPRVARYTGLCVGALVATYITFEDPLSGMSMNPARSLASAAASGNWQALWVYFAAPAAGMLCAAEVYVLLFGAAKVRCAKLHHQNNTRCIFCAYQAAKRSAAAAAEQDVVTVGTGGHPGRAT